jgi:hypothetical protein
MRKKLQSNKDEFSGPFIRQKHTFNVSKKLTADSLMPYFIDGEKVFKKVSHVINHDPLYIWNMLYGNGNKLSLAKCAHNKLMQIMQQAHPDLFKAKEKRKLLHKQ